MTAFLQQSKLNTVRLVWRDWKSSIAVFAFPIFFYILYTRFFTFESDPEAIRIWNLDYLVSMVVYALMYVTIQSISNAVYKDYANNFDVFVTMSPTPKWKYYLSVSVAYVPIMALVVVAVTVTAMILNQVSIPILVWLGILAIVIVGSMVFALLGILISFIRNYNAINVISNLLIFPLAILGGLWWPINMMPDWLQNIGKTLPSYHLAEIARNFMHEQTIQLRPLMGLLIWAAGLFILLVIASYTISYKEPE